MNSKRKTCNSCGKSLCISLFGKRRKSTDGLQHKCKKCSSKYQRERRKENPDHMREIEKSSYYKNQEKRIQKSQKWNKNNTEKYKENYNNFKKANPGYHAEWMNNRYHGNEGRRLHTIVQSGIARSLNGSKGGKRTEEIIGYKIEQLRVHLLQTLPKNLTVEECDIDHIIPLVEFDVADESDPNLRLAWSFDNLRYVPKKFITTIILVRHKR